MAVAKKEKTVFETLSSIDVNEHTENKRGATYLTWAWAWSIVKKTYPSTSYKINATEYDEVLGFMVHTEVTIAEETMEMWLPVMDGANKSMKKTPWSYKNKRGEEKIVAAATTFDINKAKMRCLVKNLAMFGLGIYIYAGEDLPEETGEVVVPVKKLKKPTKGTFNNMMAAIESKDPVRIKKVEEYIDSMVEGDMKLQLQAALNPPKEEQQEPPHEHKAVEIPPMNFPPPEDPPTETDEDDDLPF